MKTYTQTRTNVYSLTYHLTWVTKDREKVFTDNAKVQILKAIITREAKAHEMSIQELKVCPDHVCVSISAPPKLSVSNMVRILKGRSAYEFFQAFPDVRQELCEGHLWAGSYLVSSLGDISPDIVKEYIDNQ